MPQARWLAVAGSADCSASIIYRRKRAPSVESIEHEVSQLHGVEAPTYQLRQVPIVLHTTTAHMAVNIPGPLHNRPVNPSTHTETPSPTPRPAACGPKPNTQKKRPWSRCSCLAVLLSRICFLWVL
eukprot:278018-Rhodomonas_salina.3